jgi:uncharacterized protein YllA (UPF0747 family)
LKFEELSGTPEIWSSFLCAKMPFVPASRAVPEIIARADSLRGQTGLLDFLGRQLAKDGRLCYDRTRENLQRLQQPESVVVLTNFYPGLFGGPAFQLFKCLTAIKICEELARHKLQAVPICWISGEMPRAFSRWSLRILNNESEICSLDLEHQEMRDPLPGDRIAALFALIEESGHGNYDTEVLEILKSSFSPDTTLAGACARLVAALMKEWGIIVLDPRSLDLQEAGCAAELSALPPLVLQCSLLPVIATVIDPFEVNVFAEAQSFLRDRNLVGPAAWPQASATVLDSRSRRILDRYGLDLKRLYAGADAIITGILDARPREASEQLGKLKLETEERIAALNTLCPGEGALRGVADSGREKIVFQLDRLKQKLETARKRKEEMVRRQISRTCNALAPNGRIQERELGGIQMLLRYSCAALRPLYEKLDILSLEHQLIAMD